MGKIIDYGHCHVGRKGYSRLVLREVDNEVHVSRGDIEGVGVV